MLVPSPWGHTNSPNKGLAVGTAKHHQNKHGDLYHLWPGCPSEEPGKKGWFCQVASICPLASALLVTLETQHFLACCRLDALLSHVLHKTCIVPWGQPHFKAWRGLLGQPPFSGGRQRRAPSWSQCLEQGHPTIRQERTTAMQQGQASCLGCYWVTSATPPPPSSQVPCNGY